MTIGGLARLADITPSAIRYYERLGLLPPPPRRSGRRDYDPEAVAHLAVVQFALSAGFTLRQTRQLLRGFSRNTTASKTRELDDLIARATAMKALLERIGTNCRCETLTECGRGLARNRWRWTVEHRRLGSLSSVRGARRGEPSTLERVK